MNNIELEKLILIREFCKTSKSKKSYNELIKAFDLDSTAINTKGKVVSGIGGIVGGHYINKSVGKGFYKLVDSFKLPGKVGKLANLLKLPIKAGFYFCIHFLPFIIATAYAKMNGMSIYRDVQTTGVWSMMSADQKEEVKELGTWWKFAKPIIEKYDVKDPKALMDIYNDETSNHVGKKEMDYQTAYALLRVAAAYRQKGMVNGGKNKWDLDLKGGNSNKDEEDD